MSQLTPHADVKKQVSEILKRVDHLIKAGNVDMAVREVICAKEIDHSNAYICAYEERLEFLRLEHEKHAAQERSRKEAEEMARERDRAQGFLQEQKGLEEERNQKLLRIKAEAELTRKNKSVQPEPHITRSSENISVKILKSDRISPGGTPSPQQPKTEQQIPTVSNNLRQDRKRGEVSTILVIDDEEQMLDSISQILSFHGFKVIPLATTDEALTLLQKWTPTLILCDVNLKTSTMGGFGFYESIRRLEHLNEVPFIFLTGMNDSILIRTGKEMGVDDYLTKPITEENLVAAVKGKLKRFGLLNRNRQADQTT